MLKPEEIEINKRLLKEIADSALENLAFHMLDLSIKDRVERDRLSHIGIKVHMYTVAAMLDKESREKEESYATTYISDKTVKLLKSMSIENPEELERAYDVIGASLKCTTTALCKVSRRVKKERTRKVEEEPSHGTN